MYLVPTVLHTHIIENLIVPKTFIKKSYYYNLDMIFMIYLGLDLREVYIMSLLKIIHRYVMMFLKRIKSSFYIYLKYIFGIIRRLANFVCTVLHIQYTLKNKKLYSMGFFLKFKVNIFFVFDQTLTYIIFILQYTELVPI